MFDSKVLIKTMFGKIYRLILCNLSATYHIGRHFKIKQGNISVVELYKMEVCHVNLMRLINLIRLPAYFHDTALHY